MSEILELAGSLFTTYPISTFCVMTGCFGWLGYVIVTQYLMEKQIRSFFPKTIFTITFMCSVSLLAMYLYEISSIEMGENLWDFLLSV